MPGRYSGISQIPLSKRIFDLLISSLGLILTSPLLAVLAVLVWINHGRPILFSQPRPGHNGKIFTLYKFRSMSNELDSNGNPLPDTQRITRLGHFLRATSLDELPELINVLRGEMSLVGPRPLLVEYLPRYSAEQRRRHDVLPGITGWAQVNGRNALTWEEKFALDVWYVDHWSFGLDIKILWLTVGQVLQRRNITPPGQTSMEEFRG
ncbi:MAG TPA: sugar transferase [Anaerolineaceae bacterium]|nr:MAG: sugar transferase [Chloroflexi bacterium GWB2_54_36]HAL15595.1 sugar transferase [Anaerolineaceae bacterium]HBA91809.1 sugar transferase [Anaerolineaceae bacterium]